MTSPVFVLGGTGMLGTAVIRSLLQLDIEVRATARVVSEAPEDLRHLFVAFDAETDDIAELLASSAPVEYVVNCIGVIKPYIHDEDPTERKRAIAVNSQFPYALAAIAERSDFHVIQIATDCVYSGGAGLYDENDLFDATDVYGKSKSLGEVPSEKVLHIRCSIIGPEVKSKTSLLEWVLSHEAGSSFSGYTDHIWNGVTAQAFGRVAGGIILGEVEMSGTFHLVPDGVVTKEELSRVILEAYGRSDVEVVPTATGDAIDRTLATVHPAVNAELWRNAGYATIPSVQQMVVELAQSQRADSTR